MPNSKTDGIEQKTMSKEELQGILEDIAQRILDPEDPPLHSVIAINQILRLENADQLISGEIKSQLQDIWIKLKSNGIQLVDPPILFGLPENFEVEDEDMGFAISESDI